MYRLMLADDSEATQQIVTLAFKESSCQVICLANGVDVLDYISHSPVDIMLIDVDLPGIDGYQLCEILHQDKQTSDLPIVLMGSIRCPVDEEKARGLNYSAKLEKPFETIHLEKLVESLLPETARGSSHPPVFSGSSFLNESLSGIVLNSIDPESAGKNLNMSGLSPEQLRAGTRTMTRTFVGEDEPCEEVPENRLTEEDYSKVVNLTLEKLTGKLKSIIPEAVDELISEKRREKVE